MINTDDESNYWPWKWIHDGKECKTQEDFRKSEDKLATIPALRNQLNKLLIERKQSRKVLEMLTELSLKADNENIVSDFSFYKLDDAVFTEGRLGNKLKIFLIGSAFLVFLSSLTADLPEAPSE